MIRYYQEISLLPKARIGLYDFWKDCFQQLHLALVENKVEENVSLVGVSFPEYDASEFTLGTKVRLFAEKEQYLEKLQCDKWLERLSNYVDVGPVSTVPEKIEQYTCFKHLKLKGSREKMARRRAKRHGQTFEEAMLHYKSYTEPKSKLPYINMFSQSTGKSFRLFIEKQVKTEPTAGTYSCYGFSNSTTVPLF